MGQRALKPAAPPPPAVAHEQPKVRSLDPKDTNAFEILRMVISLSTERRGIVGDVKRNVVEQILFLTYAKSRHKDKVTGRVKKAPYWTDALSMGEWAELLNTGVTHVNDALRELENAGVVESIDGKQARAEGLKRGSKVHPLSRHYRLSVEKWGAVKVWEPPKPQAMPERPKAAADQQGKLRLGFGQQSEPLPIGAKVEQCAFRLKGSDQADLELEIEPGKVTGDLVLYQIGVARKQGQKPNRQKSEHILLQQDMQKSEHLLLQQEVQRVSPSIAAEVLLQGMKARGFPVSPEFAYSALQGMNWPSPHFVLEKIDDSAARCKKKGETFKRAWVKTSITRDVLAEWPQVKDQWEASGGQKPGHCVNCGAPPDFRSNLKENSCKACGKNFALMPSDEERAS